MWRSPPTESFWTERRAGKTSSFCKPVLFYLFWKMTIHILFYSFPRIIYIIFFSGLPCLRSHFPVWVSEVCLSASSSTIIVLKYLTLFPLIEPQLKMITVWLYLLCMGEFNDVDIINCVAIETSPEQLHHQSQPRSSEVHSKKTVVIKTIETRDGEVTWTHNHIFRLVMSWRTNGVNS